MYFHTGFWAFIMGYWKAKLLAGEIMRMHCWKCKGLAFWRPTVSGANQNLYLQRLFTHQCILTSPWALGPVWMEEELDFKCCMATPTHSDPQNRPRGCWGPGPYFLQHSSRPATSKPNRNCPHPLCPPFLQGCKQAPQWFRGLEFHIRCCRTSL